MSEAPQPPKRKRGRPPAAPGTALDAYVGFRAEPSLKEKCDEGGDEWIRETLRNTPLPPKDEPPAP